MHLSREEAISILETWKSDATSLRVYFSRSGANREFHASIRTITISAIELDAGSEVLHVDLEGAEFNGDKNAAASSDYRAIPNGSTTSNPPINMTASAKSIVSSLPVVSSRKLINRPFAPVTLLVNISCNFGVTVLTNVATICRWCSFQRSTAFQNSLSADLTFRVQYSGVSL